MVDEKQLKIDKCGFVPRQYHARYFVGHTSVLRRMRGEAYALARENVVSVSYCVPGVWALLRTNKWNTGLTKAVTYPVGLVDACSK